MLSTRKKRPSNGRLLSHLDYFDQDIVLDNAVSNRQQDVAVNEGTGYQDFAANSGGSKLVANENMFNVQILERCFDRKIDRELDSFVHTVEDRIRNAILTTIDKLNPSRIELAVRSLNASPGRDANSVILNSELEDPIGITASFENVSERTNTLHVLNTNDESW